MADLQIYRVRRISQASWDEYDSFVCTAESEDAARMMHPGGAEYKWTLSTLTQTMNWFSDGGWCDDSWVNPETVEVTRIGKALEGVEVGIECASFNAG